VRRVAAAFVLLLAFSLSGAAHAKEPPAALFCQLPKGQATLPARALRGLAHHLRQYPSIELATPKQKHAAERLLAAARRAARKWPNLHRARAAGYDTRLAERRLGDRSVHFLHAERRHAGPNYVDPNKPKSLIYANAPGQRLVLVGVMFSMPRGRLGPNIAGPITRWHRHEVCARRGKRGLKPLPSGSCPAGAKLREGSEMLHLWFTKDLRSAFAVHGPVPELCKAGLLSRKSYAEQRSVIGM
jgi:hypothetical protein